jgi:hypothetical protein
MFQKCGDAFFFCGLTVFNQTGAVSFYVTLFQVFYQLTGKIPTFKTVNKILVLHTVLNFAFSAMFGLAHVIFKATHARFSALSYSNMLVADGTIHTAWRKHNIFNFIRHFHFPHSFKFLFIEPPTGVY